MLARLVSNFWPQVISLSKFWDYRHEPPCLAFKSYHVRNTLLKAIASVGNNSSDGAWQSISKGFWKGVPILDAIRNIFDSWGKVKVSLTGVLKKLIGSLIDDFEGFRPSVEKVTADVEERTRELELDVEPKGVTELLQTHGKAWVDEELFHMDEQRKWFL